MVDRHQVPTRTLGERIAVLELMEGGSVVAMLEMRELVHHQVVEHPIRQGRCPRGDPDLACREGAASPEMGHVGKRDRHPYQPAAEMPFIEQPCSSCELGVGGLCAFHALCEARAHLLRPSLPLDMGHPIGHQQLENARAEPSGNRASAPAAGDDADGWGELLWICFQDVVLRLLLGRLGDCKGAIASWRPCL